jgi:glutaminyl-tRNA synthetase
MASGDEKPSLHFIQEITEDDLRTNRWGGRVCTRFPPEPNGYLHIGHAKSVCLNYGLAAQYGGQFNLRFDDTNPEKEEQEYVDSIIEDIRWLGAKWPGMRDDDPTAGVLFASDYYEHMYQWAEELVKKGRAYVCELTPDKVTEYRGTLTRPGKESPYRSRTPEENLDLFRRMRAGEFPDGTRTLRAKIDIAHSNLNLRDPIMYRIMHEPHHRQGAAWCIYPMYDWAHGFEDSLEGITHSICTLEFENHRPLYDWFIDAVNEGRTDDGSGPWGKRIHHPRQIEFARLELTYTVMSKRRLLELVKGGYVRGWDDPRMPTLSGLRRRGFTPEAIRNFCRDIGIAKFNSVIEMARLENAVRDDLNKRAPRVMAVLRPLKLVIDNYPEGQVEQLDAVNNPEDSTAGKRQVPFSRVLYIERDDFRETPPKGYFRLFPGNEVRLRYAYFVRCTGCVKDPATGEVVEVHCAYDPATRGGDSPDGRKVKGTLHWVSAGQAVQAEARLYDVLFSKPDPDDVLSAKPDPNDLPKGRDYKANLNPNSLEVVPNCLVEPSVAGAAVGARYQFERLGYFCVDKDSDGGPGVLPADPSRDREGAVSPAVALASKDVASAPPSRRLVFNRTVTLKDSWAKIEKKR